MVWEEEFQRAVFVVARGGDLQIEDCAEVVRGYEGELCGPEGDVWEVLADWDHEGWLEGALGKVAARWTLVAALFKGQFARADDLERLCSIWDGDSGGKGEERGEDGEGLHCDYCGTARTGVYRLLKEEVIGEELENVLEKKRSSST